MELKRIETPGIAHYAWLIADGNEAALVDPVAPSTSNCARRDSSARRSAMSSKRIARKRSLRVLVAEDRDVPSQDLSATLRRMPARPASAFILERRR